MLQIIGLVTLLSTAAVHAAFAAPDATSWPTRSTRVRTADARTAVLLAKGLERSQTMRTLVSQLEQGDVIAYIEMSHTLKRRLAGRLTWITAARNHRYVRISINPELSTDLAIATLGHELQHALEVAKASEIVSGPTLERYYARHGDSNRNESNGWDTEAARIVGEDVRRELAGARSARVAESIQELDPDDWLVVYRRARGMLPP